MEKAQIVARQISKTRRSYGVVTDTEIRGGNWKYLKIQWIQDEGNNLLSDEAGSWVRVDEVVCTDAFSEMAAIQKAMTLSSAILSEPYKRVLERESEKSEQ